MAGNATETRINVIQKSICALTWSIVKSVSDCCNGRESQVAFVTSGTPLEKEPWQNEIELYARGAHNEGLVTQ
jgi:hypothetical protein